MSIGTSRLLSVLSCLLLGGPFSFSHAQVTTAITADGTLGTTVTQVDNVHNIDAGTIRGPNQFHSFDRFSVGTGDIASFNGPSGIENILSRVTGGLQSDIDGVLRSTVTGANLFLLNPNGVMFHENASLDLTGSFHASTSDYIGLADGTQFTALPSAQDALLTTATPAAFGFLGTSPGSIDINDSVLTVPDGETLSLVGGDISITGSSEGRPDDPIVLGAAGGRIDLVSVASPGEATFTSPLNADGFSDYGNISIKDSVASVSADTSGEVYIRGGEIVVDSASVLSDTVSGDGGDITIKGDNVLVRRDEIRIVSGENVPRIRASTSGAGDGGTVQVEAQNLIVDRGIFIQTDTVGVGRGGDMHVDVDRLEVRDTGAIFAATDGPGRGGDVIVHADSVLIDHDVASRRDTGIHTETGFGDPDATGDGGNMLVTARTAEAVGRDANFASTFTAGHGRGGDVVVNAEIVRLLNGGRFLACTEGPGDAGNIDLHVGRLEIRNAAGISAGTFGGEGGGDGGDVHIEADSILLSDDGQFVGFSTATIGSVTVFSSGDAGDIEINTGSLEILEAGNIQTATGSPGRGGNLTIAADSLVLDAGGDIFPTGFDDTSVRGLVFVGADAPFEDSGPAGNTDITAGTLVLRGGAAVVANTGGANPGGTITVDANTVVIETDARIDSGSTGSGPGGSISLSAQNLTLASGGNIIASSAGSGLAGDINISVTDSFQSSGGFISTEAVSGNGGNITVNATNLVHLANSSITTSVQGGAGAGGNITIDPQFVVLNSSNITANAFGGSGGNIRIVAGNFFATPNSVIQASSAQSIAGTVEIDSPDTDVAASIAQLPESFLDASALLPQRCAARSNNGQSSFVVAGRGGMPIDPDGYLPSFHAADLTTLSANADSATDTIPHSWVRANDAAVLVSAGSGCR